ncbi:hypothetical protein HID58_077528 [Brassica napus]|uniref:peptide-methionine (S)-S-oxide reductase n=1 Tax=Brassica napus TaxID=3708 RepID=A0ABQ7YTB3_BRANA|nr:hypothetical protein HID58_077528 [Brassica napus]
MHGRTDALKQRVQQGESMDSLLPIISSILTYKRVLGLRPFKVQFTGNPSYEDACSGTSNHVEIVRNQYDPKECRFESLLELFWWSRHDPTTLNRQKFYRAEEDNQQYLSKGGRFGLKQSSAKGCNDPIRCYG